MNDINNKTRVLSIGVGDFSRRGDDGIDGINTSSPNLSLNLPPSSLWRLTVASNLDVVLILLNGNLYL